MRSLDVDVVLDLTIHDLDIVLSLVGFGCARGAGGGAAGAVEEGGYCRYRERLEFGERVCGELYGEPGEYGCEKLRLLSAVSVSFGWTLREQDLLVIDVTAAAEQFMTLLAADGGECGSDGCCGRGGHPSAGLSLRRFQWRQEAMLRLGQEAHLQGR